MGDKGSGISCEAVRSTKMLNDKILIQFHDAKWNVRFFTESQKTESVPIMRPYWNQLAKILKDAVIL